MIAIRSGPAWLWVLLAALPPPVGAEEHRTPASATTTTATAPGDALPESEANPLQVVFFSVRTEYTRISDQAWSDAVLLRSDRILLRDHPKAGGKLGLLTRLDVPLVAVDLGESNAAGLGDLYFQAIHAPKLTRRFALGLGAGLTLPTATDDLLGGGKWRIEPLAVPVVFFPRSKAMFLVLAKRQLSFAGSGARPDIDMTQLIPVFLKRTGRRVGLLLDSEVLIDHRADDRASFRTGVEVAWYSGRRLAIFVKPDLFWGGHQRGDWRLKVTFTRFRRR